MSQPPEAHTASDTEAKTLALLRRLLVGNGYQLADIALKPVEEHDLHIPGRIMLELQVVPTETRLPGLPKGNEAATYQTRDELAGYIGSFHAELAEDTSWIDDIRARLAKNPGGGWGLEQGDWELAKQTKRVALVEPCTTCRGQKMENCRICFGQREINCPGCSGAREIWCKTCSGNGVNPQDRNSPCPACRGKMKMMCPTCQARGRVVCHNCRGQGQTPCTECQGHGFFTEETLLKVAAQGRFEAGTVQPQPKGLMSTLDAIGIGNLHKGHAVVTPMPSRGDGQPTIMLDAILPYGRYNLTIKSEVHDVIAVGVKPVLAEFPPLLDDTLSHIPEQLNAGTVVAMGRKYRIIRELAEALGRGEKPARFFGRHYPYGLTAPMAFAISGKLQSVFAGVTLLPRTLAGIAAVLGAAAVYYNWLAMPRAFTQLPVPPAALDGALALLLTLLGWVSVGLVGQWAIRRVMPMKATLRGAGGLAALATALIIILTCAALLWLPDTRPDWVKLLLR